MYSRQICLPEIGIDGQQALARSTIAVIGVGGLGCSALMTLAAAGVGRLILIDGDLVELSNLPRQLLFAKSDIGTSKVDAAYRRLSLFYPETQFEVHPTKLDTGNATTLLHSAHLILDATDNRVARYAINDACRALQKPWIYGAIDRWEGQVALFTGATCDYRTLFPEETAALPDCNCESSGVIGAFVGVIGSIEALEAIKWCVGMEETLANSLLCVDSKTWRMTRMTLTQSEQSQEEELILSLSEIEARMQPNEIQWIDARLPALDQLVKDRPLILYCERGVRSRLLAKELRKQGYRAYALAGGMRVGGEE